MGGFRYIPFVFTPNSDPEVSEKRNPSMKRPVIGVVLHGCGAKDGSEIHEAVFTMGCLEMAGAEIQCLAPHGAQARLVNHATGVAEKGKRDMFDEAARIARGNIKDLSTILPSDLDGLVIPGGFGTAYNLCDFADRGVEMTVLPMLEKLLKGLHAQQKPIGAVCVAPVILAKVFGRIHPRLTLGEKGDASRAAEEMGAEHIEAAPNTCVVDEKNLFVTTPAYMTAESISAIFPGIQQLAIEVVRLASGK